MNTRRSTRTSRPSAKVRDIMPGIPDIYIPGPGFYAILNTNEVANSDINASSAPSTERIPDGPEVILPLAMSAPKPVSLGTNMFGICRLYMQHPLRIPDLQTTTDHLFTLTAKQSIARATRTVADIILPYPNITTWHWGHNFWTLGGGTRSMAFRKNEQLIIGHPDFNARHLADANIKAIKAKVLATKTDPWSNNEDSWNPVDLTIGIPVRIPRNQADVRDTRNQRLRVRQHNLDIARAPPPSVEGEPYVVKGAYMRSLTGVIKHVWEHDPLARRYHTDGFEEHAPRPVGSSSLPAPLEQDERVMRELYNSPEFLKVEAEV